MIQLLDFESIIADINPNTKLTNTTIDMSLVEQRKDKLVYVAEDSPVIRRLLVQNFTKAGYQIKAFENGSEALKAISKKVPNLLVTDLEMPVTSGDFVVRKLRESLKKQDLPIVVFSSMASDENERKLLSIGANMFIGKPELSLLVSIVDDYLIKKKPRG
jgi:two-component system chemotaxis response regulator CheV